jgi:CheY-like chemotaxis protein
MSAKASGEMARLRSYQGKRILLAEDNAINQQIAIELLGMVNITVDVAENGKEAVEMICAAVPDKYALVLMDLQMPVMDGHQATMEIRRHARYASVPIVALTAHAIGDIRDRCIHDGMQDFLTKPIYPEHLFALLERRIGNPAETAKPEAIETKVPVVVAQDDVDLSLLSELNTVEGLRLLANKRTLYLKLLQQFRIRYGNATNELARMMTEHQFDEAERMVHTLKGLAGNMGAGKLVAIADRLEQAFHACQRDITMIDTLPGLCAQLDLSLNAVLRQLNTHLPPAQPARAPV